MRSLRKPLPMRAMILFASLLLVAGAAVGIYLARQSGNDSLHDEYVLRVSLPPYAYVDDYTLASYMIAVEMPQTLEMIPCYCACRGHENLKDCFLQGDGYTPHAANCRICMDEAVQVAQLLIEERLSIGEVRRRIDREFSKYGATLQNPQIQEDLLISDLSPNLNIEVFYREIAKLVD